MINEADVEKAVDFLRDNAKALGDMIGRCKALEQKRKVVHGQSFLEAQGTVAEREAKAYSSDSFKAIVEEIENAWADKSILEIKFNAAETKIDVWRSQNSAKNRGHV